MKSKTLILMVVAVACGLVASYLTSRMLAKQGDGDDEKVKVLVARNKIPMGTKVKEPDKLFVEKEFSKDQAPKKAITNFEILKDRRLNKTLSSEVHVTPEDLMSKEEETLVDEIPAGQRAMSIPVSAPTNVAGFVLPKVHVDIVSTTQTEHGRVSRIIMQDMLVLAVDMQHVRDDKQAMAAGTVTLQVKPDEAERLTLARSMGELSLLLRSMEDHETVRTTGARMGDLSKQTSGSDEKDPETGGSGGTTLSPKIPDAPTTPQGPVAQQPPAEPPPPKTHTLTIYNGETPTKTVFVLNEKNEPVNTTVERSPLEGAPPTRKETPLPEAKDEPEAKPEPKKNSSAKSPSSSK
jgi:pilus assembly protein CpaB